MAAYHNAMSSAGKGVGTIANATTSNINSNVNQSYRSMQEVKSHEHMGHNNGLSGNYSFDTS